MARSPLTLFGGLTAFLMTLNSAVLAGSSSVTIDDGEELICTYPGFSETTKPVTPVIVKYRREGDFLVETSWGLKYRILQNSPDGLIAVWSIAEIEPNHHAPSIATFSVMLEKKTRKFMFSNAVLDEGKSGTATGSCL
jgi:hypothetical protein